MLQKGVVRTSQDHTPTAVQYEMDTCQIFTRLLGASILAQVVYKYEAPLSQFLSDLERELERQISREKDSLYPLE